MPSITLGPPHPLLHVVCWAVKSSQTGSEQIAPPGQTPQPQPYPQTLGPHRPHSDMSLSAGLQHLNQNSPG